MSESRDDLLDMKKDEGASDPGSSGPAPAAEPEQDIPSWLMLSPAPEKELPTAEPGDSDSAASSGAAAELPAKVLPYEPSRGREPERKTPPEPHRESPPQEPRRAEPQATPRQPSSTARPQPGEAARTEPPRPERPRPEPASEEQHRRAAGEPRADIGADTLQQVVAEARARASRADDPHDYQAVVQDINRHLANGYSLLGLVGYAASGKTHFLKALSFLLKQQGFEVADVDKLLKPRSPGFTPGSVFDFPCTGPRGEKWVFVDASGDLYSRVHRNDWELPEKSASLLHTLFSCRGLFLLIHLHPGHFRGGAVGAHRYMSDDERAFDSDAQIAQEEIEFFDHVLLFLRALKAERGDVMKLARRCTAESNLDKALRSYRDQTPKLDIPVMVLFSQADTFADSPVELATGSFLSPRKDTVNVAAFAARYLPGLFGSLVRHTRRFKFDFVQSYEAVRVSGHSAEDGDTLPQWDLDGEYLSVGAFPALEFLKRNLPAEGWLRRFLQRRELETRHALSLDRLLHPRQWWGVKVNP